MIYIPYTKNVVETKPIEEDIENLPSEEIEQVETTKKYTLKEIIKTSSCALSKEKNYIWENVLFSEKFYEILTTKKTEVLNKYTGVYLQIENILMGDFGNSKERTEYHKGFYYVSYLSNVKYFMDNIQLLFVIYYTPMKEVPDYSIEYLEFLEISETKDDINKALGFFNFKNKFSNDELEFDKQCFLDSNIFFSKISQENDGVIIRYPNSGEIINKSDKVKKLDILGKKQEDKGFVDIEKLKRKSFVFDNVLNIIRKKDILDYDLFFSKKVINFTPSKTEKNLINKNNNFILSGRPGTGKTFVILVKAVLTYLNCWAEHSKLEKNLIDWDYIREKYLSKQKAITNNDNYKIVVTSLSHVLCLKAEELFSQCMRSLEYNKEYVASSLKQIENLESFQSMKKNPMFLNFRKIIFLIDGSLNFQFFDRPTNNRLNKIDNQCDIKYIPNLTYDVNYEIDVDNIGNLNYFYRSIYGKKFEAKEINEDDFYREFNTEISKNKILNDRSKKIEITTSEVYSQIISIIKGSSSSYLSLSNSIPREQYKLLGKKITMFTEEQKDEIYDYYIKYENWKKTNKYFDFQDVVNYLIRQVSIELVPENVKLIDILFIDEVQDFSINQLYLMSLIAKDIKVLAGDTCQTISKTNAFRFCDLNSIYYISKKINKKTQNKNALDIPEPEDIQTNLNFRCHYPILKLAHLIYEMIFLLFPQTLDKVKCDYTKDITGYKPSIITNLDEFIKKLIGGSDDNKTKEQKENNKREFTFAFNHCFICRNSEAEKKLSEKYNKKILASTVKDSKGMEYEIVIIYNFFKDALPFVLNLWTKVLNHMKFSLSENPNLVYIKKELEFEEVPKNILDEVLLNFKDKISISYMDILDENMKHKLYNMCSELKELYVAVTRAKTSLFFYDEDMEVYPTFIKILRNFNIINREEDQNQAVKYAIEYLKEHLLEENELRLIAEDNLKMGNYKKAEFYFNILKDEIMSKKAFLFYKFDEIQKMKNNNEKISQNFIESNKDLLNLIYQYKIPLDDSDIEGEIYINIGDTDKALKFFKNKKNKKKCGLIYQMTNKFKEAFKCFDEIKEYGLAIECLIKDNDFIKLFKYIISNQNVFNLEHFSDNYKKYASNFIQNYDIKFSKNKDISFNTNKSKEKIINYFVKYVYINKFKSIFDDRIASVYDYSYKETLKLFPKIKSYSPDDQLLGLNYFKERHFFQQESKEKYIKYIVTNNVVNESNMFFITKHNNISKTNEEIFSVFDDYVALFNFCFDYLSFNKNNLDEYTTKYIEEQKNYIKDLKEIKYNYQQNEKNNKREENASLKKDLKKLLITKVSNQDLITKLSKDWNLNLVSKDIIDIKLLKTNIVPYFIKNFPLLILHKSNDIIIKDRYANHKELFYETLREIVKICKQLPLCDEELIKCLESTMILCGHFKVIFPFLSKKNLFLFSALFKKNKIFQNLLIEEKFSFSLDYLEGGIFNNEDNFYFIFNSFLRLFLCKYFHYRAKAQITKKYDMYNSLIREILKYFKEYPKIYSLLYNFEYIFQRLDKVNKNPLSQIGVPFPISQYIGVFAKFLSNYNKNYTKKEIVQFIEIGNTISLYITINGLSTTSISYNDINNNSENNFKIARFLIKLKELLLVYKPKSYVYQLIIFSLFSALGVSLIPRIDEFKLFNYFPCCIINDASILFWSSENYYNYLELLYKMSLFDSTSKNRFILFNMIYKIFNEITHRAIVKIFHNENPFFSIPSYNYLYTQNLKKYFDSLLYNYSFHRKKYLYQISNLSTGKEELIDELVLNFNSQDASYRLFDFGFVENFFNTLCNWPNEDNMEKIDIIFFPFYRWEKRVQCNGILNFTQISIILGELPMVYEKLAEFNESEYKKYMSLIFDINENLFNEILYLYAKMKSRGSFVTDFNKLYLDNNTFIRIFINNILFSLLINKFAGYKFDEFSSDYNNEIKENIINKNDYLKYVKELLGYIGYKDITYFETSQKVFPYKIVFDIFRNNESKITKLLKIIWLKKLYPLVVYSLKKSTNFKFIDKYLPIYGINHETIDFRYFIYNKIQLTDEEIIFYFDILKRFISDELFISKAETRYFFENFENSRNKEKYSFRPYLQNYIELQLYMLMLSISKLESSLNLITLQEAYDDIFAKKIKEIIDLYNKNSFYKSYKLDTYTLCDDDTLRNNPNVFNLFLINEKNKLEKSFIKIYELTIREINVSSYYACKEIELKNIMNKNLLNNRFLFINNKTEQQQKELEKKQPEYIKQLIRFVFVPLKKENLPQYLKTAQTIYDDFYASKIKSK